MARLPLRRGRQVEPERAALRRGGVVDLAAEAGDDAFGDVQAQASAVTLGGHERLKNVRSGGHLDAAAGVADTEADGVILARGDLQRQLAIGGHGVQGVYDEVHDDAADAVAVGRRGPDGGVVVLHNLDLRVPQPRGKQLEDGVAELREVCRA